jgi:TRAP-type C4-dicarboxylate transport system substrate-binding protein
MYDNFKHRITIMRPAFLLALGLGLAASALTAQASPLQVKFAWYLPDSAASARQDIQAAKNIEAESHGTIKVTTYPAGSLYTESQMAEAIQNNSVNLGVIGLHWWGKQDPALAFDQIPFLFPGGVDELHKAIHGKLGDDVNKALAKKGVVVVGWGYYGYDGDIANTKKDVMMPDDLHGLKLRANGPLSAQLFKTHGATPTAMGSAEIYTALQRGTIDGAISGMSSIVSRKWYEVAKHVTALKSGITLYPIYGNLQWWKGLTDQQRKTIRKAVGDTEQGNMDNVTAEYAHDLKVVKQAGDSLTVVEGATKDKWIKAAAPLKNLYLRMAGDEGKTFLQDIAQSSGH